MKVVYLEWVDIVTDHGWEKVSDIKLKCAEIKTIGFLIKEDSKNIALALNHGPGDDDHEDEVTAIVVIPKAVIKKRVDYKLDKGLIKLGK